MIGAGISLAQTAARQARIVVVAPSISLSSVAATNEGNSGTTAFTYTLTLARNGNTASIPYTWAITGSGSNPASAADFGGTFPTGSGTFATGETSKTITVLASGDTAIEPDEAFMLTVTSTGAGNATANGTILNDDAAIPVPTIALSSVAAQNEGNSGTTAFVYTLTLTRDGSTASIPFTWAVTGSGSNPAAAADFGGTFPTGSDTFATGQTSKTITVLASGDAAVEPDETFTLTVTSTGAGNATATGTVLNDDSSGAPATLRQVATRSFVPNTKSGSALASMCVTYHVAATDIVNPQLKFPGWYNLGGAEVSAPAAITYTASIEYPAGVRTQILWSGATQGVAPAGGETPLSDPPVLFIPKGSVFAVANYATTSSAGVISTQGVVSTRWTAKGEASVFGAGATDQTMTGGVVHGGTDAFVYPLCIVASSAQPAIAGAGDSRTLGSTSSPTTGYQPDANGNQGQFSVPLGVDYGWINMGNGGEQLSVAVRNYTKRRALARAYTQIVEMGYGVNDMRAAGGNRTSAQYLGNVASFRTLFHGMRYVEATVAPSSSGTYTSAGGQTADANAAAIIAANVAIRAKPSPVVAVADFAAFQEDSSAPGKWISTGGISRTGDGLHANAQGYADIATGVVNMAAIIAAAIPGAFSPPDIASLIYWYDLADAGTHSAASTGFISRTTTSITVGTGTYSATAFSGGPAWVFDGVSNEQHIDSTARAQFNGVAGVTFVGLFQLDSYPASARRIFGLESSSGNNPRAQIGVDTTGHLGLFMRRLDADTTVTAFSAAVTATATPTLAVGVFDPTNNTAKLYVNGSLVASAVYATSGAFPATNPVLGPIGGTATLPVASTFRETQGYKTALSDAERQKIEGEILWRAGLQALLPGDHPYASAAPLG